MTGIADVWMWEFVWQRHSKPKDMVIVPLTAFYTFCNSAFTMVKVL